MSLRNLFFYCRNKYLTKISLFSHYSTKSLSHCDQTKIHFNDSEVAYSAKKTSEIIRALLVFRLCSIDFLVNNNKKILKLCRTIFGKYIFEFIMKQTIYGHFVAGSSQEDIKSIVKLNRQFGVKSILDYSVEEDITEEKAKEIVKDTMETMLDQQQKCPDSLNVKFQTNIDFANRRNNVIGARTYFYTSECQCDENIEIFKKCINASSYTANEGEGFTAVKLTSMGPPQLLMHISDILIQLQNFFKIFAEHKNQKNSLDEIKFDLQNFQERLKNMKIEISYDEQLKWFTLLDVNKDSHIDLFEWLNLKNFEHNLGDLFKIKDLQTGVTKSLIKPLSKDGILSMRRMLQRLDELAEHAKKKNTRLMIDAEQSYFQPAIRRITLELMRRFNKEKPIIFNTYQCYLKDALEQINSDLAFAGQESFYFGAKLVRGAYMEQERERARIQKYTDPINSTYEDTTYMYNDCMDAIFHSILQRPRGMVLVMIASHNIETIQTAIHKLLFLNLVFRQI